MNLKNKFIKACLLLGMIITYGVNLIAQDASEELNIQLLTTTDDNDHVILRWAPTNVPSWEQGIQSGYNILRFTTADQNGNETPTSDLGSTAINIALNLKPIPEAQWEPMADNSDMAGVAAGAIYGESFDVTMDSSEYSRAYAQTQERQNRFGYGLLAADSDIDIALAMGLAFKDETVLPNATYRYIVKFSGLSTSEAKAASASIVVEQSNNNISPQDVQLMPSDSVIQVTWTYDQDAPYSSYVVERSEDGGSTFTQLNEKPIVSAGRNGPEERLFFSDKLPNNSQTFHYRIKGKNPFGLFGNYSEVKSGKGIPKPIDGPLGIEEGLTNDNGSNTLVWSLPTDQESDIVGFKVMRSNLRNGVYEELTSSPLPVSHRTFSDPDPLPSSYYRIIAIDADDQELTSMAEFIQLDDSTPPEIPSGLEGICTPTGAITLEWSANRDDDLKGYRVYVSNQRDGRYTQVSETWLRNPIFYYNVDMASMAEEIFFKTVALDKRDNASDFSAACLVIRPDVHPPAKPLIASIEALAEGISIDWIPSSSEDVVEHRLERRPLATNTWTPVVQTSSTTGFELPDFLDEGATENTTYIYRVVAVDEADNTSYSDTKSVIPISNLIVDGITNLYCEVFTNDKKVYMKWNYGYFPALHGFDIYRSVDGDTYRYYKSIDASKCLTSFEDLNSQNNIPNAEYTYYDEELISKNRIKYKVQVQMKDGRSSLLSDPVILLIQ